jgi:tetratricopeptide (TPR) repeat protein
MVKRQMQVEREHREDVENLKKKEFDQAQEHIQRWVEEKETRSTISATDEELDYITHQENEEESSDDDIDVEAIRAKIKAQFAPQPLPPPRASNTTAVEVSFTSRGAIPTNTARETEDQKWLTRIKLAKALHARSGKATKESLDSNEAKLLKQKGIEFFRLGNFESAIHAFTDSIKHDPTDTRFTNFT